MAFSAIALGPAAAPAIAPLPVSRPANKCGKTLGPCRATMDYVTRVSEPATWSRSRWEASESNLASAPCGPGGNGRGGYNGGSGGNGDGDTSGDSESSSNPLAALLVLGANPAVQRAVKDALICAATFMTADILVQLMSGTLLSELDTARVLRLAAFGLLIKGPTMSWFYNAVEAQLPGRSARRVVEKVLVDQTGWAWVNNLGFLFMIPVMEGRSVNEAFTMAKQQFPTLQKNAYMLWPLAHLVNFGCVPPGARTLYISAVSLAWTTICCLTRESG